MSAIKRWLDDYLVLMAKKYGVAMSHVYDLWEESDGDIDILDSKLRKEQMHD